MQWAIGIVFTEALSRTHAFYHPAAKEAAGQGLDKATQAQAQVKAACRELGREVSDQALWLIEMCFSEEAERCTPAQLLQMDFPWG